MLQWNNGMSASKNKSGKSMILTNQKNHTFSLAGALGQDAASYIFFRVFPGCPPFLEICQKLKRLYHFFEFVMYTPGVSGKKREHFNPLYKFKRIIYNTVFSESKVLKRRRQAAMSFDRWGKTGNGFTCHVCKGDYNE